MSGHCNATPYEYAGYDDFAQHCSDPSAHLATDRPVGGAENVE